MSILPIKGSLTAVGIASAPLLLCVCHTSLDSDGDDITVDGTIRLCEDLNVNPEDVVLLAVAYELKSPSMGQWSRKGWTDGWKALG